MTLLDMMDTKLNAYSRIEVNNCSAVNTKSPISREAKLKSQSNLNKNVIIFVIFLFNI